MDIQELWEKIQGEFSKVNTRLGNVETKVEVKEVKYENKGIREELAKINGRLDVIQRVDLANILQKQNEIQKELNSTINMNNLEHENFKYRCERLEKALGVA